MRRRRILHLRAWPPARVDEAAEPCQYEAVPALEAVPDWVWVALSVTSVLIFLVSLIALRYIVIWLPADYFTRTDRGGDGWLGEHPALRLVAKVAKNVLGLVLVAAGLVMLLTPGQGILALLLGVSLLDVPGKEKLERRIVGNRTVLRAINSIRRKAGRAPLEPPARD